jgi:hypothetical protein
MSLLLLGAVVLAVARAELGWGAGPIIRATEAKDSKIEVPH